jgi:hypothetical protein
VKLGREQAISIAALLLLLLGCASAVVLSIGARSGAAQEFAERLEALLRLEAKSRQKTSGSVPVAAPPAAFLDAPTQGLASIRLQAYLAQVAGAQQGGLTWSGQGATNSDDPPDMIRLQATLELSLTALQAMLYQLETGTPYVLVEELTVQPKEAVPGRPVEDPLLGVTFTLRAFWRRSTT